MLAIVLLGIYALYNVGAKGQRDTNERVTTMLRQQNGLERMTREMRQAVSFTPVSSQVLDAVTYVRPSSGGASVQRHVRYECLAGSCKRYEGPVGGALGTGETVIPNLVKPRRLLLRAGQRQPDLCRSQARGLRQGRDQSARAGRRLRASQPGG